MQIEKKVFSKLFKKEPTALAKKKIDIDINIYDQIKKFHFSKKEYIKLINYCHKVGIKCGASTFTEEGLNFLIKNNVDFIKIASMDTNNIPLIKFLRQLNFSLFNFRLSIFFNKIYGTVKKYDALCHKVSIKS